jgi:hypothetical protein
MKRTLGLLLLLTLICSTALAQDYTPSAAVLKNLNAHAVAYTGQPCISKIKARAPRSMSATEFDKFADFMDTFMQTAVKKLPGARMRSALPNRDGLYRAETRTVENGAPRHEFMLMYHDSKQVYTYSCDLK